MYLVEHLLGEYEELRVCHVVAKGRLVEYLNDACKLYYGAPESKARPFLLTDSGAQMCAAPEGLLVAPGNSIEIGIFPHSSRSKVGCDLMRITCIDDGKFEAAISKARTELVASGWTNLELQVEPRQQ